MQKYKRTYCIAQGTIFSALQWPIREKNLKKKKNLYIYKEGLRAEEKGTTEDEMAGWHH